MNNNFENYNNINEYSNENNNSVNNTQQNSNNMENVVVQENNLINENIEKKDEKTSSKLVLLALLSLIITTGSLFLASNFNNIYILITIPIYYLIGVVFTKNKDFTLSIILGTMFGGLLLFILSIIKTDMEDLFTYLSIECVIIGIIGYTMFSLLYRILHDKKNAKGIHVLMFLILSGGITYGLYYLIDKYPNYISKYIYCDNEVIATNEKDYIVETLNSRYGLEFYCDTDIKKVITGIDNDKTKVSNRIDQSKRTSTNRYCTDASGNIFSVESIYYSTNKYVVFDEYINKLMIEKTKKELESEIETINGINKVTIGLYSKNNCHFVGDCVDVDEYYDNIEQENDIEKQYEKNNKLTLKKYVQYNEKDFINEYGFKYQLKIEGVYNIIDDNSFDEYINNIIKAFNDKGYKNTNGMEIIFYEVSNSELKVKKAHYILKTNNEKIFKEYAIKE